MTRESSGAAGNGEGRVADAAISGYRPEALQALPVEGIATITHSDNRAQVLQWLERYAAETPHPSDLEVWSTRKDSAGRCLRLRIRAYSHAGGTALQILDADVTEPNEGEAARRQSERLVQASMDALPVSACLLDAEGHILLVNEEWRQKGTSLRIGPERMRVGMDYLSALRAASGENAAILRTRADKIDALLRGEMETFTQETPAPEGDGTPWLLSQVRRFQHEGTMRAIVTHTDITEQKRSEEALRSSDARARAMLESVPDLMFRLRRDGTFLEVQAAPKDLYAPLDAYLGRTVGEVLPPAVTAPIMESVERALATGEVQTLEYALEIGGEMRRREARMAVCAADEVIFMVRDVTERWQAAEALRESSRLLQATLDALPVAAGLLDETGVILFVNEQWRRQGVAFQVAPERLRVGADYMAALRRASGGNGAALHARAEGIEALLRGEIETFAHETPYSVGGETLWALTEIVRLLHAGRMRLLITQTNITEQKRAEEALRESSEFLQSTLDAAAISIGILDEEGRLLAVNEVWRTRCDWMGRDPAWKTPGNSYLTVAESEAGPHREAYRERVAAMREMLAGQRAAFSQEVWWERGEERRWFLTDVTVFTEEGRRRLVITQADITEQKRAEEALRESSEFLQSTLDAAAISIGILDEEGRLLAVNAPWRREVDLLGLGPEWSSPGSPYVTVLETHGEPEAEVYAECAQGIREIMSGARERFSMEASEETSEERRWYFTEVTAFGSGSVRRVVVTYSDITARKRAEEAAQAADARVHHAQRMESVGNLAAGIAHDFNNLLTVIQANLSEAERRIPEAARPEVRLAQTAAHSAAELSEQLLAIGRGSGGPRGSLGLAPVVGEVYALLRRTVHPNIVLEAEVAPELEVVANASQLRQVLLNVAVNACAAMPDGGRLVVRAARLAQAPDLLPRPEEYVGIDIADTGMGMEAETAARAFEPFYTTKGERGSGLGLAMVYGIVQEHGGAVTLDTARGRGTVVHVLLPAGSVAAGPTAGPERPAERPAAGDVAERPATILVVDDLKPLGRRWRRSSRARGMRC